MLKIAIPNKGALSEGTVDILKAAGYRCKRYGRELTVVDHEHGVEFIYLRPRDIAVYVESGILDAGVTGRDLAFDSKADVTEIMGLNFGRSRFLYALPKELDLTPDDFAGKRIATSYPNIVKADLDKRGIDATVVRLDGAVEISIRLGVADVIADVVESGRTLKEAGLKTVGDPIMVSEAVFVTHPGRESNDEIKKILDRMRGILVARSYCLLEYVCPVSQLEVACKLTPGVKSPTLSPVHDKEWMAVAAMVSSKGLNSIIDSLSDIGCKGIIAHNIQTCRL